MGHLQTSAEQIIRIIL